MSNWYVTADSNIIELYYLNSVPFEVSIAEDAFYIMGASVLAIFRSNKPWIVALCKLSDGMHHTDYTDCMCIFLLPEYKPLHI